MNIKNDFFMPIAVLFSICLFVSAALAIVNNVTRPVIDEGGRIRAAEARRQIIPHADEFVLLAAEGMPRSVTEVHRAANGAGYVFTVTVIGYGGEIRILCGVDSDGKIIRAAVLSHTETAGLGTPVFEEHHAGQYWERDINGIDGISIISGATITSVAFKNAMRDALRAFETARTQQ